MADAQWFLGSMLIAGSDTGAGDAHDVVSKLQDDAEAFEWFRLAADQGHAEAQWMIGRMYELGRGVEQDIDKAIDWFRKAANLGLSDAQQSLHKLGCMFPTQQLLSTGNGNDYASKIALGVEHEEEQLRRDAQFRLGCMFSEGEGIEQDAVQAMLWFLQAAQPGPFHPGHADAQFHLALLYDSGNVGERDVPMAMKWFRKAAEQDQCHAQFLQLLEAVDAKLQR